MRSFKDFNSEEYYENEALKERYNRIKDPIYPYDSNGCARYLRSGPFETYYENGNLKSEGTYKPTLHENLYGDSHYDGYHLSGHYRRYYLNGRMAEHSVYDDDGTRREQTLYSEDGKETKCEEYNHLGMIKTRYLYENGKIKSKEIYERRDGSSDGVFKIGQISYDEKGNIIEKIERKQENKIFPSDELGQELEFLEMEHLTYEEKYGRGPNLIEELKEEYDECKFFCSRDDEKGKKEVRKGLCKALDKLSQKIEPTEFRKKVKRAFVADFRKKYPDKKAGR